MTNAYTANKITTAPTVASGHATEITPIATASRPRHSRDVDIDMAVLSFSLGRSVRDHEQVLDITDAWCGPGTGDGVVALGPRADRATKSDRAVDAVDGEVVRVELGVA